MELSSGEQKSNRDFSLTFIQVVCAIAVVTLHTNGVFWTYSTERWWFTANIIECLCYFAVPVFFMITGITLLDYQDRYSTGEYFRKRVEKTLIPYIAWSLFAVVFMLVTGRKTYDQISALWVVNGLLSTDGIINLYWFFKPLFCVYLSIPLFANVKDKKKTAEYLILIGMLCNVIVPFLNSTMHINLSWGYQISVISGYLLFVWGGYYAYNYPPSKKKKEVIYLFAILGLMLHIVGTYVLSVPAGSIQQLYKGYNNLPCVLYSFGAFFLLRDIGSWIEKRRWIQKLFVFLGEYTFSLYLIHWYILRNIDDYMNIDHHSIWYRLLAPYVIYAIVIGITWCLRKIPVIRRIVP